MKNFILRWISSALSIYIVAKLFENVYISGFGAALWASIILGITNTVIKPLFILLTLPINILTLGLFTLVINGIMLKLTAGFVPGFEIKGLIGAIVASIVLSIINLIITHLFGINED